MIMSTLYHDSCGLCDSQTVGYAHQEPGIKPTELMAGWRKCQLFHDPCAQCDDLLLQDAITLCHRCQHLRIPHIFGCMFESRRTGVTDFFVAFDLCREQGENCEFCLFLASSAEKILRSGDASVRSDVIVGMKPFRRGHIHKHSIWIFAKPNETKDQRIMWPPILDDQTVLYRSLSRENPQHVQPYLNWSWACGWITDIQGRQDCGNKFFSMPSLSKKLHNVLVVDVVHRCVVDLPLGAKYLALSYVWGANSEGVLQCTTANRKLLEEPGSLGDITSTLPRTISDAISVCAKLNYNFLWVDRLCIMQDHPQISVQLDQMAAIYHQAALTIFAMEGDDATHGLPGVSNPRKADQPAFRYADNFELVHETPSLYSCRERSTWDRRGWTYQEYIASSVLMYFTNFGLYVEYWQKGECDHFTEAEGPADDIDGDEHEVSGLHLIQDYSGRTLTHRRDKLRGISGIHQAMYEGQITFGIPLNDFEHGIAWQTNDYSKVREPRVFGLFPTWSWASVNERVFFPTTFLEMQCSLVYWGWAKESQTTGRTSFRWRPIRDRDQNKMYANKIQWSDTLKVSVALAWLNGCFYNETPEFLSVDCSAEEWHTRVTASWPGRDRPHLPQALQNDEQWRLLCTPEANALCASGRIMANTSKSIFKVEWNSVSMPGPDGQYGIVRTGDGRLAGSIFLDDPSTDRFMEHEETSAEFIALAIISDHSSTDHYTYTRPITSVPTGIIYGCPCSNNTAEAQGSDHIQECDKSSSFTQASFEQERSDNSDFYRFGERTFDKLTTHEWAYFQHCKGVSFRDQAGRYLNSRWGVPEIKVLMIAPGPSSTGKGKVYRRLGIGRIFLKRWVESSPVFDTIVLE
jgi:hypothetical protein